MKEAARKSGLLKRPSKPAGLLGCFAGYGCSSYHNAYILQKKKMALKSCPFNYVQGRLRAEPKE